MERDAGDDEEVVVDEDKEEDKEEEEEDEEDVEEEEEGVGRGRYSQRAEFQMESTELMGRGWAIIII